MCFHFVTEFRHKHLLARTEAYKSAVGPSNKHFCPSPKKRIFPLNISPQKYMNRWNKSSWSIPMTFLLGGGGGGITVLPLIVTKYINQLTTYSNAQGLVGTAVVIWLLNIHARYMKHTYNSSYCRHHPRINPKYYSNWYSQNIIFFPFVSFVWSWYPAQVYARKIHIGKTKQISETTKNKRWT